MTGENEKEKYSPQNLKCISDEVKLIFNSKKTLLFDETTLDKIFIFAEAILYRSKFSPSNSLVSLLEITWKNFIYPLIVLYRTDSFYHDETITHRLIEFLKDFSGSLETSKNNSKLFKHKNEFSKIFTYKLCLIQGDIFKYITEIDPSFPLSQSESYYLEAIDLDPSDGIPFNQAGTLMKEDDPLKSLIYFYLATLAKDSCHISEMNASSVLSKHREEFFQHIKNKKLITFKEKLVEVSFMNLLDAYLNRMDDISNDRVIRLSSNFIKFFLDFLLKNNFNFESTCDMASKIIVLMSLCFEKSLIFPNIREKFAEIFQNFTSDLCEYLFISSRKKAEYEIRNVFDEEDDLSQNNTIDNEKVQKGFITLFMLIILFSSKFKANNKFNYKIGSNIFKILHYLGYSTLHISQNSSNKENIPLLDADIFEISLLFLTNQNDFNLNFKKVFDRVIDPGVYDINFSQEINDFTPPDLAEKFSNQKIFSSPDANEKNDYQTHDPNHTNQGYSPSSPITLPKKVTELNFKIMIPLSDIFVENLSTIKSLISYKTCSIHILVKVFDFLDSNKESKETRDAIRLINDHFSQESMSIVAQQPENGFESKAKHRNKALVELSESVKYATTLVENKQDILYADIAILISNGMYENQTLYDHIKNAKELGISVVEVGQLFD